MGKDKRKKKIIEPRGRRGRGENLFQPLFPTLIKLQKTTGAFLQFNQCRKSRAVSLIVKEIASSHSFLAMTCKNYLR
jgi:hypothetical protein